MVSVKKFLLLRRRRPNQWITSSVTDDSFEEIKLSENLHFSSSGKIEGFVDLGKFTAEGQRSLTCDHGLVVKWHQIIGAFASHSNVKADMLVKILLEAVTMSDNAGLRVDFITCDGETWNRSMWRLFGISGRQEHVSCRRQHPTEPGRFLYFVSDFPHLIKCARNKFVETDMEIPEGKATVDQLLRESVMKCTVLLSRQCPI